MASAFKSIFKPIGKLLGGNFDPAKPVQTQLTHYNPDKHGPASPLARNPNLYGNETTNKLLAKYDKIDAAQKQWNAVQIQREGRDTGLASSYVPHLKRKMQNAEISEVKRDLSKAMLDVQEALLNNLWYAPGYDPKNPTASVPPPSGGAGVGGNPTPNPGPSTGSNTGTTPAPSSSPVSTAAGNIIGVTQTGTLNTIEASPRRGRRGRVNTIIGGGLGGANEVLGA